MLLASSVFYNTHKTLITIILNRKFQGSMRYVHNVIIYRYRLYFTLYGLWLVLFIINKIIDEKYNI